ncbi:MAG: helix-turn-helix domain-containing protein [Cyanobacteriota bacterium]|nr:helix-turn-helix domain-containing protein [Cyanobacteriota bacterium]
MKSAANMARVIACRQAGWSKRRIATELSFSRNTVTRIINRQGGNIPWPTKQQNKLQATLEWLCTLPSGRQENKSEDLCAQLRHDWGLSVSPRTMDRARVIWRSHNQRQPHACQDPPEGWQIGPFHLRIDGR